MPHATTIFAARKIITMNPSRSVATHVAVRDGRVVLVGTSDDMRDLAGATLDERFADKVLLPGFVEGHAHVMEGTLWARPYVGAFARRAPDGTLVAGAPSVDAAAANLAGITTITDLHNDLPDATVATTRFTHRGGARLAPSLAAWKCSQPLSMTMGPGLP